LLAAVTATELAMLNVIFWARAQGSLTGLVVAVAWPWIAVTAGLALWESRGRWAPARVLRPVTAHSKLSLGIWIALAMLVLFGRLVAVA
jgi:hypothetical protein